MRLISVAILAAIPQAYPTAVLAQSEQNAPSSQVASPWPEASRAAAREGKWCERLKLGLNMGGSLTTFVGPGTSSDNVEYVPRFAHAFGGLINVRLYPWLSLQSEVLFASKGAEAEMEGLLLSTFEARYVQVPLLVRASRSLGESVSVYGFTGPTWDFLLSYRAQALDGSVLDLTDRARQMDLGLLGGAGLELVVSAGQSLTFEGRYSYSLQTISRDESEDFRNRVFAVMLGYQFSFSSRMMQEPPMLSGKNGSYGLGLE